MINFYVQIINDIGIFNCVMLEGTYLEYEKFKNELKLIYQEQIFESELDNGEYIVMSNELIQKSIFKIVILNT